MTVGKAKFAGYAVLLAALAFAPAVIASYDLSLLGRFLALGILGLGICLMWGYAGILSLGQGVFFALGAYSLAMHLKLVATKGLPDFMVWNGIQQLPAWWTPFHSPVVAGAAVILVPTLVAGGLGWLVFRRRVTGVYVSLITQALALAFATLLISQQGTTGGFNGLTDFSTLFGFQLNAPETRLILYWATLGFLTLAFLLSWWIAHSHVGKLLLAIRDGENRVRFLGYDPAVYKTFIFAVGGGLAGLAGALYTLHLGVISPAMIGVVPSIEMIIGVAIGGRDVLGGAVLGTVLVNFAKDRISSALPDLWLYLMGVLFILVVMVLPNGLAGLVQSLLPRRRMDAVISAVKPKEAING